MRLLTLEDESQRAILAELRAGPLSAADVAEGWGIDRSTAHRRLERIESQHARVTSRLEAGPSGRGRRRVWRWS